MVGEKLGEMFRTMALSEIILGKVRIMFRPKGLIKREEKSKNMTTDTSLTKSTFKRKIRLDGGKTFIVTVQFGQTPSLLYLSCFSVLNIFAYEAETLFSGITLFAKSMVLRHDKTK